MACPSGCTSVIDSYSFTYADNSSSVALTNNYVGQAFTMGGTSRILCCVKFKINSTGDSSSIIVQARIYACTGTPGSTGVPTGSVLASSESKTFNSDFGDTEYEFGFLTPYTLASNTNYCIVLYCTSGNELREVRIVKDITSPTHSGNLCQNSVAYSSQDCCFFMYYNPTPGWSNTINGVSSPAKINEIIKANIYKINGV